MSNKNWHNPSWDELFMRHAYLIASKSKDTNTKIGAVLVRDNIIISEGYNGIPRGVSDDVNVRDERPIKYFYYEHAERNAIYNCARNGVSTAGSTLYCVALPCADCCRGLLQSGVKSIVVHKQWDDVGINKNNDKWKESSTHSSVMLFEAKTDFKVLDMELGVKTMINGNVYIV